MPRQQQKRHIDANLIYKKVYRAIINMHSMLPKDVLKALKIAEAGEPTGLGKQVLARILENLNIAVYRKVPMCQDTGMLMMFVQLGEEISIECPLEQILQQATVQAYKDGYLRKSTVQDPLKNRQNSGDNLPALIYYDFIPGNELRIGLLAKGFGSENCSKTYMLKPTDGKEAVVDAVLETVRMAGGKPCPPTVLGIGIGGTLDIAAKLSKKALLRSLDAAHRNPFYRDLEKGILKKVNDLGIGPGGLGGKTTSLAVLIETSPTHIAGLPLAISVNCWADRKEVLCL